MPKCAWCKRPRNEVKNLLGPKDGPLVCNFCIQDSGRALAEAMAKTKANAVEKPLPKPHEIKAYLDKYVIGQDRAKRALSIAVYNHYKRRGVRDNSEVEIEKSNILLMGPSGTGKTAMARAIAKFLSVPFHIGDATRLTAAGYVGDDVESLLQGLVRVADGDIERAQWGILFVDEIDKIARKSGRMISGQRDIGTESVQQGLLKILEGNKFQLSRGIHITGGPSDAFDTTNVLFIAAGSFAGIEESMTAKLNKNAGLGFGASDRKKPSLTEVYESVTEDNVLDFGLIPELVGRLPVLTTCVELTEDQLVQILTEPKNAIVKQMVELFRLDGVVLSFDDAALFEIAKQAKKRPTGVRALRSILEKVLDPYVFEVPGSDIEAVRVTEECVKGTAPAVVVRRNAEVGIGLLITHRGYAG